MCVRHPHLGTKTADIYGHFHREEESSDHMEKREREREQVPGQGRRTAPVVLTDRQTQGSPGRGNWHRLGGHGCLTATSEGREGTCPGGCLHATQISCRPRSRDSRGCRPTRCLLPEPSGPKPVPRLQKPEAGGSAGTKGGAARAHGCHAGLPRHWSSAQGTAPQHRPFDPEQITPAPSNGDRSDHGHGHGAAEREA